MNATSLLAVSMLGGCFIEQLPSHDDDGSGMTGITPPIRSLAVGDHTSCAVLMNRTVRCWGSALVGAGGVPGQMTLRPVEVPGLGNNVEALALTVSHGCVLSSGAVQCYGTNDQGQIGNGAMDPANPADLQPAIGATGVAQLSLQQSRSAARTAAGGVLAWGAGFSNFGGRVTPTPVDGVAGATDLSLAYTFNCAVTGGPVLCWGLNYNGQLGRGTLPTSPAVEPPAPVVNVTDATHVVAGEPSCVLHAAGTVSCWGLNTPTPETPTPVAGLTGVKSMIARDQSVCALTTAGTVVCWGGTMNPTEIPGLSGIVELAGSLSSACARAANNDVFCWGMTVPGDGSMMGSATPVRVRW